MKKHTNTPGDKSNDRADDSVSGPKHNPSKVALYSTAIEAARRSRQAQKVDLDKIDPRPTALRSALDPQIVADLVEMMKSGHPFAPVTLRRMGDRFSTIDGDYRIEASKGAGRNQVDANIVECDDVVAEMLALSENSRHGTALTKLELRDAVHANLTKVPGLWTGVSSQAISLREAANLLGVSHWLIASVRDEILAAKNPSAEPNRGSTGKRKARVSAKGAPASATTSAKVPPSPGDADAGKAGVPGATTPNHSEIVLLAKELVALVEIFARKLKIDPASSYTAALDLAKES